MDTWYIQEMLTQKYKYKKLSEESSIGYRKIFMDNIPQFLKVDGDNIKIFTEMGTLLCNGYNRIVVGDYGAFLEFSEEQANIDVFFIKEGQEYRIDDPKYSTHVKYNWYTIYDGCDVKIYHQMKTVDYADYKIDCFYVDVHEIKVTDAQEK